jgi:hypothetical protein
LGQEHAAKIFLVLQAGSRSPVGVNALIECETVRPEGDARVAGEQGDPLFS